MGVPEIDKGAAAFLETISEEELKEIFLERGTGDWEDSHGPSGSVCLAKHIYKNSGEGLQIKIKNATVKAISEWNPDKNKRKYLSDLAFLAALARIQETVPGLIQYIDNECASGDLEKEMNEEDGHILSVIVGFSPNEQIKNALEKWHADKTFPWKADALICVGLLMNDPEKIDTFLPKFLKSLDEHPEYFVVDLIAYNLDREVKKRDVNLESILGKFVGEYKSAQSLIDGKKKIQERLAKK